VCLDWKSALAHLSLHVQGRISRLVGQIVAASQQWRIHRTTRCLHPPLGGGYSVGAIGSSVCREARDGACVGYAEEDKTDKASAGIIRAGAEETPTCEAVTDSNAVSTKCAQNKCDVTIGGNPYCSQCSTAAEFPINGVCTTTIDGNTCTTGGVCTQCKDGYFLHKGGCYKKGEEPGSLICKDATGTAGKCQACADGYFKNSDTAATTDSCVACGDENCATCTVGAEQQKCSKCKTTGTKTYLKGDAGAGTCVTEAECTTNNDHYTDSSDTSSLVCKACSTIVGCSTCSSGTACTKCTDENYLKTVSGVTTCVTDCGEGYFKHTATDSSLKTCQSCSGTNNNLDPAGAGVAGCAACTYDSAKVTCTKCGTGKYLKSDGTCADSCTANTEFVKNDPTNGNKCVSCGDQTDGVAGCSECSLLPSASRSSATLIKCTKCGNSKYLKEGTCADKAECTGTTFPKEDNSNGNKCVPCNDSTNGGVADCTACALTTDSSRTTLVTCSACSGNKIVKTADGATSCIDESACNNGFFVKESGGSKTCEACDSTCKTCSGAATQCTSCNPDKPYLKKTQSTNQTGTCTTEQECTNDNTHYADDADPKTCKACAEGTFEGCETCEKSTEGAVACKTCGPQKKIRPDKKGCIDASPPDVSTEKSGVCECVEGYTLEGGNCASSSANKSGLSTGAIVGISVAAVVACPVPLTGYLPLYDEQSKQSYYC
ncbi:Variant-specific surface protein, partial [Giardia duodenalis]